MNWGTRVPFNHRGRPAAACRKQQPSLRALPQTLIGEEFDGVGELPEAGAQVSISEM